MLSSKPTAADPAKFSRRWQQGSADQRRQLIVHTALELLDRQGPGALTMRRVAAKLGLGVMTLYTYVDGCKGLYRHIVHEGFAQLHGQCQASSTLDSTASWRGGARAYVQFALDHPNLYKLMFDTPSPCDDQDLLHGGLEPLLEKVRRRLAERGLDGEELDRRARREAGRFWIALHGLATLAIAGRLDALHGDIDSLLDDLLERVSPG